MSNPKRTRKEIREAIKKIKIKRKLNSKNPKYKSGYNNKEDESEKRKQTKILINETKGAKIYAVYKG